MERVVGLDFGTTNSALAVLDPGKEPQLATYAAGDAGRVQTYRSILYFEREDGEGPVEIASGPEAVGRYLEAVEKGRLVQSLKSFLASRSFSATQILGTAYRLEALIGMFVRQLRDSAEAELGPLPPRVVVGRPVRFAHESEPDDALLALRRLEAGLHNAGFREVVFEYEPVAAAYFYERELDHDELILIADFGGGTSDFSPLRVGPSVRDLADRQETILGTDGVAVAGDAFDARIVRNVVAPELGMGTVTRSIFERTLKVPDWIYTHLQRWHHLSFLKSHRTMQILLDLRREALEPRKLEALLHIVRNDLGYLMYRSVERAKLGLTEATETRFEFDDAPVRIDSGVERSAFEEWIAPELAAVSGCVDGLLERLGVESREVDRVFMTGGSSFVPAVREIFVRRFGEERIRSGSELTSVATGLALRARY
jgi:hypothetical chaperone protein